MPVSSYRAIAWAVGRPAGPAGAARPSPQQWWASGTGGLRQRTWRLGTPGCRPPRPGRLGWDNGDIFLLFRLFPTFSKTLTPKPFSETLNSKP